MDQSFFRLNTVAYDYSSVVDMYMNDVDANCSDVVVVVVAVVFDTMAGRNSNVVLGLFSIVCLSLMYSMMDQKYH
jgi:hypothetical protein